MNIKSLVLGSASIAALALVSNASAADLVGSRHFKSPVASHAAAPFSWEGFYAGVQVGAHNAVLEHLKNDKAAREEDKKAYDIFDKNSFAGGLYAGYNLDLGNNIIAGIDGNINVSNFKIKEDDKLKHADSHYKASEVYSGDVSARLGYAMDRALPYVSAGLAYADAKSLKLTEANKAKVKDLEAKAKLNKGWSLGAGLDYAFADNLILRADYRFNYFKNPVSQVLDQEGKTTVDEKNADDSALKINNIRVGIAYKF